MEALPTRRVEALASGSVHYFTGKPCHKGHVEKRLTCDGRCVECCRERLRQPHQVSKRNAKRKTLEGLAIHNKSRRKCYYSNPKTRMAAQLRARMHSALRNQGVDKAEDTFALTGCTPQFLRDYLLEKAKETAPGATLENYGLWQIDHIKAVGTFDLSDPEQQRACFHYTNLQPLWKLDHQVKTKEDLAQIRGLA